MPVVQVEIPDDIFSTVRRSPQEVAVEMRISAACSWYVQGVITQGQGAHIAGLSRSAFVDALARRGLSASQETMDEIEEVLARG